MPSSPLSGVGPKKTQNAPGPGQYAMSPISRSVTRPSFGIMALSYNSMGILLLLSACVLVATADPKRRAAPLLAGLFFAGAVLCCPYLLLLYVLAVQFYESLRFVFIFV